MNETVVLILLAIWMAAAYLGRPKEPQVEHKLTGSLFDKVGQVVVLVVFGLIVAAVAHFTIRILVGG